MIKEKRANSVTKQVSKVKTTAKKKNPYIHGLIGKKNDIMTVKQVNLVLIMRLLCAFSHDTGNVYEKLDIFD